MMYSRALSGFATSLLLVTVACGGGDIDPLDTRNVLALGIAAARHAPIERPPRYGVFRM